MSKADLPLSLETGQRNRHLHHTYTPQQQHSCSHRFFFKKMFYCYVIHIPHNSPLYSVQLQFYFQSGFYWTRWSLRALAAQGFSSLLSSPTCPYEGMEGHWGHDCLALQSVLKAKTRHLFQHPSTEHLGNVVSLSNNRSIDKLHCPSQSSKLMLLSYKSIYFHICIKQVGVKYDYLHFSDNESKRRWFWVA